MESFLKPYKAAVQFCEECGAILDIPPQGNTINCEICARQYDISKFSILEDEGIITTKYYNTVQLKETEAERAKTQENCPNCGHNEMYFNKAQLRGADEGETVFYECVKCKHKFQTNNQLALLIFLFQ